MKANEIREYKGWTITKEHCNKEYRFFVREPEGFPTGREQEEHLNKILECEPKIGYGVLSNNESSLTSAKKLIDRRIALAKIQ